MVASLYEDQERLGHPSCWYKCDAACDSRHTDLISFTHADFRGSSEFRQPTPTSTHTHVLFDPGLRASFVAREWAPLKLTHKARESGTHPSWS